MSKHTDFILCPINGILTEVVSACVGIGSGIETFPLSDYIMQSVFLKMTGFQEQKMKCICWELATNDYEYRYEFTKNPPGECSSYREKQTVYNVLVKQIVKQTSDFNIAHNIEKTIILESTRREIEELFTGTNLSIWTQRSFSDYLDIWNEIELAHFANENKILLTSMANGICLRKIYEEHLYKHRNRCAHNTLSYQQNLPTLKILETKDNKYNNYFMYFSLLILIDKVFIDLYKRYLEFGENS